MNSGHTMLLCAEECRKRGIANTGKRKHEGTFLGTRRCEWLSKTCHALSLAFCGGNTDVTPNDRLPIIPETHEKIAADNAMSKKHWKKWRTMRKLRKRECRGTQEATQWVRRHK